MLILRVKSMASTVTDIAKKFIDKASDGLRALGGEIIQGIAGPAQQPVPVRVRPNRPHLQPR